jgi:hypothetical protein
LDQCRACRAASMNRLVNLFTAAHSSKPRLERFPAESVKTSLECDPAPLPSKGVLHQRASCDSRRAAPGMDPIPRPCSAYGGFAATRPRTAPLHQHDLVLLFANTIVLARPPFMSADLIDADTSLGRVQPLDFCNEFSNYDTRAHNRERCPHPP